MLFPGARDEQVHRVVKEFRFRRDLEGLSLWDASPKLLSYFIVNIHMTSLVDGLTFTNGYNYVKVLNRDVAVSVPYPTGFSCILLND